MARRTKSEEGGHSQEDGASGNMSLKWTQVEAALSSSSSHFEDANKSILQFCEETSKRVNETSSNLKIVRRDVHALKQQAEDNVTSINTCRAQDESHDDCLGHLERRLAEVEQDNRVLSQQVENLKARQALDQTSLQELKEKVDEKLNQWVQPVTITAPVYLYPDGPQALATGTLEGQQAFDSPGNPPGAALNPENQVSETKVHTNTGEVDGLLNSSAETLPSIPKTPDTSFESKQRGTQPVVGVTQADAWPELGERKQPNQRGLGQEGDNNSSDGLATKRLGQGHPAPE